MTRYLISLYWLDIKVDLICYMCHECWRRERLVCKANLILGHFGGRFEQGRKEWTTSAPIWAVLIAYAFVCIWLFLWMYEGGERKYCRSLPSFSTVMALPHLRQIGSVLAIPPSPFPGVSLTTCRTWPKFRLLCTVLLGNSSLMRPLSSGIL